MCSSRFGRSTTRTSCGLAICAVQCLSTALTVSLCFLVRYVPLDPIYSKTSFTLTFSLFYMFYFMFFRSPV